MQIRTRLHRPDMPYQDQTTTDPKLEDTRMIATTTAMMITETDTARTVTPEETAMKMTMLLQGAMRHLPLQTMATVLFPAANPALTILYLRRSHWSRAFRVVEVVQAPRVVANTHRVMPKRDRLMRQGRDLLVVVVGLEVTVRVVVVEVEVEGRREVRDGAGDRGGGAGKDKQ